VLSCTSIDFGAGLVFPPASNTKIFGSAAMSDLLGGLASGWLVTQVGSAPKVLMVNGVTLAVVALFFLIRGHGLKDV